MVLTCWHYGFCHRLRFDKIEDPADDIFVFEIFKTPSISCPELRLVLFTPLTFLRNYQLLFNVKVAKVFFWQLSLVGNGEPG